MNIDLTSWPVAPANAADCDYCIDGFLPYLHPLYGTGVGRCTSPVHGFTTACAMCGFKAFYPTGLRMDFDGWIHMIQISYRRIPEFCPDCHGITALYSLADPVEDES